MTALKISARVAVASLILCAGAMSTHAMTLPPEKPVKTQSVTPDHNGSLANAIQGEWVITAVGTTTIKQDEDMPYINFSTDEDRFYASNGCNIINGDFAIDEANNLQLMNTLMTQKMCAEIKYDSKISQVLAEGTNIACKFEKKGHESYLTLTNQKSGMTLTLRRHNMDFLNGLWTVKKINSTAVNDEEMNIFFDIESLKVHGNTGCNYFNGVIRIDPHQANSLNLSEMGVTRMSCPDSDRELQYMVALEEATSAVKITQSTVALLNSQGKQVIVLERTAIPAAN
jgi:heat shock protein HslJ